MERPRNLSLVENGQFGGIMQYRPHIWSAFKIERPRNLSLVNNGPLVRLCNTGPVLGQHLQWDGPEIPAF